MKILTLVRKDLLQELRAKESIVFILALSILFASIIALGANSAMISDATVERLFPSLMWIVFIFTATLTISKSLDNELEHMAVEGLLMLGVPAPVIFLAKVISSSILMAAGICAVIFSMGVLLNVPVLDHFAGFAVTALFVLPGYSALAVLAAGISSASRAKSLIMPLLLLPLLFPLFFSAVEFTSSLFTGNGVDFSSIWLSLLAAFDVVYIVIGLNLYEYVIRE